MPRRAHAFAFFLGIANATGLSTGMVALAMHPVRRISPKAKRSINAGYAFQTSAINGFDLPDGEPS